MAAIGFSYAWQKVYPVLVFRSVVERYCILQIFICYINKVIVNILGHSH